MTPTSKVLARIAKAIELHEGVGVRLCQKHLEQVACRIAYHEAGHVVAAAFIGELSIHARATIIPDRNGFAHAMHNPCSIPAQVYYEAFDAPRLASLGRAQIFRCVAGPAAQARLEQIEARQTNDNRAIEDDKSWVGALFDDCILADTGDLPNALAIAKVLPGNQLPDTLVHRACQWADDFLDMPDAWAAVERVAGLLLKHGTVKGDRLEPACRGVTLGLFKLKPWRRRFKIDALRRAHRAVATAGGAA